MRCVDDRVMIDVMEGDGRGGNIIERAVRWAGEERRVNLLHSKILTGYLQRSKKS